MSPDIHLPGTIEETFVRQQAHSDNLTTFRSYPFPGRLLTVPYPLDTMDEPIPPEDLEEYSRTHHFTIPHCFHGRPARLMKDAVHASHEPLISLQCAANFGKEEKCPFYST
ncbi:hypothetical protein CVT26_010284 [Gymnopilus dilepis]|uniref:Uncharacterized protein n=1 Tax=Gymnopilus dilepis TaxID=231916 RepID=A0A409Y175_9AGAR|nr:hypothetical protein CVT26_010284 [Gymnopilus dilepis]